VVQISIIRERNLSLGIALSIIITVGSYIAISIIGIIGGFDFSGLYLFADIEFALGTIFGVVFTLTKREEDHPILKSGVYTGVIGGVLSSVLISLYEMIYYAIILGPNIWNFILFLGVSIVSGIVIGLIGGALISTYFTYKEMKGETEEETLDNDFFDDLTK